MKPLLLTMQAFGPYLAPAQVDFSAFQEAGLFLISGRTGGGKTSILDAMCFALYCKATGGKRDFKSMRSSAADLETPTDVSFTFSLQGKTYRFHRALQMRKKRGSDDYVPRETHECFVAENGTMQLLESGAESAVRRQAEALLHLTCEQFSQVIVLPQGDFLRLLRASSTEKGKILETLFSAQRWRSVTELAAAEAQRLNKQSLTLLTAKEALLQQAGLPDTPALQQAAVEAAAETIAAEAQVKGQQRALENAQNTRSLAETYLQHQDRRVHAATALVDATTQFAAAQHRLAKTEAQAPQRTTLQNQYDASLQQQARLTEQARLYTQTLRQQEEIDALAQRLLQQRALHQVQLADIRTVEERLKKGQDFLARCQKAALDLPAHLETAQQQAQALAAYAACDALKERITALTAQQQTVQAQQTAKQTAWQDLQVQRSAAESALLQNQALNLSQTLQPDTPCPVCGALHHPAPAHGTLAALSPEGLQKLRRQETAARDALTKVNAQLAQLQQDIAQQTGEYQALRDETVMAHPAPPEETAAAHKALQAKIQALQAEQKKTAAAQARIDELLQKKESLSAQSSALSDELIRLGAELEEKQSAVAAAQAQLKAPSPEVLQEALKKTEAQAVSFKAQLTKLQADHQTAMETYSAAAARCQARETDAMAAEAAFAGLVTPWQPETPPDLSALQAEERALQEALQEAATRIGRQKSCAAQLAQSLTLVQKQDADFAAIKTAYEEVAEIADALSGSNPQKTPILQYVLSIMLDEILSRANRFFDKLSRGRYCLSRMQGPKGGNAHGGLDLEVIDGWRATTRNIETLSGGEQFLASLALALGLSDVVQNHSGAVVLDALFIDEGFGSLDGETLDTAMRALGEIRQSGRIVGIISHVAELRRTIPARIEVLSDENGFASLRTITD